MKPYYTDAGCTLYRANALDLPLADESVDLVITSPPYFGLRSYTDGGAHYDGQIGAEATPAEFVDALIAATAEMVRVLKPSGSIWVNLGDKYAGSRMDGSSDNGTGNGSIARTHSRPPIRDDRVRQGQGVKRGTGGVPPKSLIGVPWRYALRCIDDLGLILRAEVIWSKPNGLPESVTDRVRRSHETWFHFTKEPRYFSAVDEVREDYSQNPRAVWNRANGFAQNTHHPSSSNNSTLARYADEGRHSAYENPLGKLPGSVWEINAGEPLVRSVLNAVAAGGITAAEGERILSWLTSADSGTTQSRTRRAAGNGAGSSTATVTAATTHSASAPAEHTESPTNSQSDPSGSGSPSTTSAETSAASDLTTSKRFPSGSTSSDASGPMSAPPGTPTTNGTPSTDQTVGAESAAAAWPTGLGHTESASAPPSVWQVATQPLRVPPELGVDHFAAFPLEFPRRIIRGWSPSGVCVVCGEGRRPVAETVKRALSGSVGRWESVTTSYGPTRFEAQHTITGYACACPEPTAPTRPARILDPFGGTGTTALVAKALGRHGISVDLSADYCRLARWRVTDPGELARALEVEKPPAVMDDQGDLLEGLLA